MQLCYILINEGEGSEDDGLLSTFEKEAGFVKFFVVVVHTLNTTSVSVTLVLLALISWGQIKKEPSMQTYSSMPASRATTTGRKRRISLTIHYCLNYRLDVENYPVEGAIEICTLFQLKNRGPLDLTSSDSSSITDSFFLIRSAFLSLIALMLLKGN